MLGLYGAAVFGCAVCGCCWVVPGLAWEVLALSMRWHMLSWGPRTNFHLEGVRWLVRHVRCQMLLLLLLHEGTANSK